MDWLGKLIVHLKDSIKHIWAITIATGLLLFLPDRSLEKLHVLKFTQDYGAYIGVVFIVTIVLACINVVNAVWKVFSRKRNRAKALLAISNSLQNLDAQEQAVLREFFIQGQNTLRLPIDHPVVAGLSAKGILVGVGNAGERSLAGMLFPLAIRDDIREHSSAMIGLPATENPSQQEIEWLKRNRPEFMREIARHEDLFHRSTSLF